ncbi:MAG TPA: hypothetical protein DCZ40_07770 [Lachnospiraceae bacterium]|nr:hypothetical protein [Lachnospiraceae bacterium]
MALKDEVREQQEKLRGKSFREKLEYFWDYYKIHTLVILFAAFTIGLFIRDTANSKDDAFSAVVLNSYGFEMQEAFQEDFASYAGIDTDTYNCLIDATSTLSLDSMTQFDLAFSQRLTGLVQTSSLDAFISDAEIFGHYAEGMMFQDLREVLSEEEYKKYEPCFYYIDEAAIKESGGMDEGLYPDEQTKPSPDPADPDAMETPVPVGIYLKDSSKLAQWNCYADTKETPVFGFVFTSKRPDLSRLFLAYLTE